VTIGNVIESAAGQSQSRTDGSTVAGNESTTTPGSAANHLHLEDLTALVRQRRLAPILPFTTDPDYTAFFDLICRGLHRATPRHVLLVRDRGVGEQAALIELARRGNAGEPDFLRDHTILLLNCRQLPTEETRALMLRIFLGAALPNKTVLCLDAIGHLLQRCSNWDDRSALLTALSRTRCRVIGILSPREAEEFVAVDGELRELFSIVNLHEPSLAVAVELVNHFAVGMEQQFQIRIDQAAIQRAVMLSDSYVLNERLPYKAVKVLHAICDDLNYDRSQCGAQQNEITEADVVAKISDISGIPKSTLAGVGDAVDYHASLAQMIVGQDHVVREVAIELGLIKAGMVDPDKPASVMMFVGQTGTGKTEMAKALARFYSSSKRLKTFTLGNFSEPHSVSGIIGVPPGYVGHDQGGRLINELNTDPYGVFLLDEADKAHPDVMQPFLNLFDEGWVSDQKGNKAFANRAIFILTTNVGQRQIADMCRSGKTSAEIVATMKESLARIRHSKSNRPVFSPEFLARVKRIIVFRSLDQSAMHGICLQLCKKLVDEWRTKRQKQLLLPESLIAAIAAQAFSRNEKSQGKEGGRIVRKILADNIEAPIQRAICSRTTEYQQANCVSLLCEPSINSDTLSPDHVSVEFLADTDVGSADHMD
jgi:ATP-dependent Clp protease ATP-binding subunit ClpA